MKVVKPRTQNHAWEVVAVQNSGHQRPSVGFKGNKGLSELSYSMPCCSFRPQHDSFALQHVVPPTRLAYQPGDPRFLRTLSIIHDGRPCSIWMTQYRTRSSHSKSIERCSPRVMTILIITMTWKVEYEQVCLATVRGAETFLANKRQSVPEPKHDMQPHRRLGGQGFRL